MSTFAIPFGDEQGGHQPKRLVFLAPNFLTIFEKTE